MKTERYIPVPHDFHELVDEVKASQKDGKIHYFISEETLESAVGKIVQLVNETGEDFIITEDGSKVRMDKIITLYGTPGPAFSEYEAYGNSCMDCFDHGQFS